MKKNSIQKVLVNSGIYSITSILQKGIGFLLLPLYTLYLTPADYGITGIVNSFTQVLTLLFTLSLNGAVQRYYYVYENDKEKLKSFYGTIVTFVIFNSFVLSAIIIIFQKQIISPFIDGVNFYPYILLGVITVIFNPIYTIYQSLLQTMQKGKEFGVNSLLHFGLMVILNILFIIIFKWGAVGQLLSYLFTAVIFGIYSLYSLIKYDIISFKFNFSYLKEALLYSVPLLPHLLSSTIASFFSRLILNNVVSTSSAGIFNISSQFMLIIDTLQASVNNAYIPWFYSEMNDSTDDRGEIINFADVLSKIYMIISVTMSFFIKEVIQVFLPATYLISWTLIPIMVVAYQFKSIYLFYVNTLFYNTRSTRYIFIASLTGSLINIIVSTLLTSTLGLITPAIAILIQWVITSGIIIIISRKTEPVDFRLGKMILYVILMVVFIGIGQYRDFINPLGELSLSNILYKSLVLVVLIILLFYKDWPIIKKIFSKLKLKFINK